MRITTPKFLPNEFNLCKMVASPALLGPRELYKPNPENQTNQPNGNAPSAPAASNGFMDMMVSNFNSSSRPPPPPPPMGYTENRSPTYLSSGNPCLDFLFHVVPDTSAESVEQRLESAWDHNPLTTLKLIFNLRGVRGTGKSDREGFYTAALWLHQLHPKTLAGNVQSIAEFGYIKDMLEILYRLLEGDDAREIQRAEWLKRKQEYENRQFMRKGSNFYSSENVEKTDEDKKDEEKEKKDKERKEKIRNLMKEKRLAMAKRAIETHSHDPEFRFLYEQVADFFKESLESDLQNLNSGKLNNLSLAAKWCPSINSSFDRATLMCERIARKIFPKESNEKYKSIDEHRYVFTIRDRLRKEILVPLRKALELPEVYICAGMWDSLPYNRVASLAMRRYKEIFKEHDEERFTKYLEDVKAGKEKIAAGALFPHEIIRSLKDGDGGEVAELQWKRTVDDLLKKGKLKNCLAICDVSGSMYGEPLEVSVALGLLVSELSDDPWKGKLITFSQFPELHSIQGDSLLQKTIFVERMNWNMNTDFQKVFDVILKVAVDGNLKEEDMIKRLFVFSDMEFDQASARPWETDYQAIVRKFTEKGYENSIPEIVFWNLRDSEATPVPATQKGVALVSGFSKNLMKIFMEENGVISPEAIMEKAISGKEYQKLVVLD